MNNDVHKIYNNQKNNYILILLYVASNYCLPPQGETHDTLRSPKKMEDWAGWNLNWNNHPNTPKISRKVHILERQGNLSIHEKLFMMLAIHLKAGRGKLKAANLTQCPFNRGRTIGKI